MRISLNSWNIQNFSRKFAFIFTTLINEIEVRKSDCYL
jgi:hypothetical protein